MPSPKNVLSFILKSFLLFLVYFVSAKLGLKLAFVEPSATAVWPPTGITLAALLVLGYRFWPAVFLGAFVANLTTAGNLATSLLIAAGNTLEGLTGAWLVNRFANGRHAFERAQDIFKFVFLAGFLSTAISATLGVTSLSVFGYAPWASFGAVWLTWWAGDMAGALIVAPFLLLWTNDLRIHWNPKHLLEMTGTFLATVLMGQSVFGDYLFPPHQNAPLGFLCIPPLIWAAYRFGQKETATSLVLLCGIAIWNTLRGQGPFSIPSPNESLLLLQAFMAISSVMSLTLAAAVSERNLTEANFQRAQRAEEALQQSEKYFRSLIESALDIVTLLDAQGIILYESPSVLPTLGYTPEELKGVNAFTLVHPEDVPAVTQKFGALLQNPAQTQQVAFRYRHKNGEWVHLESVGRNALAEESVGAIIVNSRDISLRKKVEQELWDQRNLLQSIMDNMGEGLLVCDEKGKVVFANPAVMNMLRGEVGDPLPGPEGLRNQVFGADGVTPLAPEDFPIVHALKGESSDNVEIFVRNSKVPEGIYIEATSRPIRDPRGNIHGAVSVFRDITAHKRTLKTLRESEERFRLLVDNVRDYAIILLDTEGNVASWNEGAQRIKGYRISEIIGRHFSRFHTPEDAARNHPAELLKAASEQGRVEDEGLRVRKDGTRFWADVIITALKDEKGNLKGFVKITRDVTERKRLEDVMRSNTELQQFANVASHDLQEPLRMVSNYVQLIAERYKGRLDTDADEFIGYAVDGAHRMQALINGLLDYARVESRGKPFQTLDFGRIFDAAVANLKMNIAETNAEITHGPLPQVSGDSSQLVQLLQNLFGNALKFHGPQKPQIHLSVQKKGKEWVFECRDNGIGIDPKYFGRIFVIFQRLHSRNEYEGMGMGLAICKRIAERHGGRIWVESEEGKGSSFYFTLPEKG